MTTIRNRVILSEAKDLLFPVPLYMAARAPPLHGDARHSCSPFLHFPIRCIRRVTAAAYSRFSSSVWGMKWGTGLGLSASSRAT